MTGRGGRDLNPKPSSRGDKTKVTFHHETNIKIPQKFSNIVPSYALP